MYVDVTPSRPALLAGTLGSLPPLEQAIVGFLAGYDNARTRNTYADDLSRYFEWCRDNQLDPLEAKRAHLDLYVHWMLHTKARLLAPATASRRFTSVAMFYRYCCDEELIARDPAARVKRPKVDHEAQYRTWLSVLDHAAVLKSSGALGPHDEAMIRLMGVLALRVDEACHVAITDLGGPSGYDWLTVHGKGGRTDRMALPTDVMFAIRSAIGSRRDGPIVLNRWNEPMDRKAAQRTLSRALAKAGVETYCTPHGLRRTVATTLLRMGVPLREVQIQMRHADPRTTSRHYDMGRHDLAAQPSYRLSGFLLSLTG